MLQLQRKPPESYCYRHTGKCYRLPLVTQAIVIDYRYGHTSTNYKTTIIVTPAKVIDYSYSHKITSYFKKSSSPRIARAARLGTTVPSAPQAQNISRVHFHCQITQDNGRDAKNSCLRPGTRVHLHSQFYANSHHSSPSILNN